MQSLDLLLADTVLILHALLVFFVIAVVPFVWIGYFRGWRVVKNAYLRTGHLFLIGYIVAESVFGVTCPLTKWEDALRVSSGTHARYADGYIAYWLHQLMFFDWGAKVFLAIYAGFFALVVFTFVKVRPRLPDWCRRSPRQAPVWDAQKTR